MKMLTTQISGLLQRIIGNNEDSIEETARLLAQATIGEGRVILACFGEMKAVQLVCYGRCRTNWLARFLMNRE